MPRTVYYVAASADGFIADPEERLDWLFPFDEAGKASYEDFIGTVGVLVMGAGTYRFILQHERGNWPYGDTPTWVFTHRELPGVAGADITFVRGDVEEFYPDICGDAGDRDVWVVGGGELAAQFVDRDLLDDIILTVVPVALGKGRPLLPVGGTTTLTLAGTRTLDAGLVELRYRLNADVD